MGSAVVVKCGMWGDGGRLSLCNVEFRFTLTMSFHTRQHLSTSNLAPALQFMHAQPLKRAVGECLGVV
jgi:hypothetical protein